VQLQFEPHSDVKYTRFCFEGRVSRCSDGTLMIAFSTDMIG
jgi:hypothetical protein